MEMATENSRQSISPVGFVFSNHGQDLNGRANPFLGPHSHCWHKGVSSSRASDQHRNAEGDK
jgi:hypothetical protein